jgi:hypothetical protein
MNFSEFLREREEIELLDEALLEEGVVGGTARAVKGLVGNAVKQTARGVGNVVGGAGQAVGGLGRVGLGAIQGLTGGGRQAVSNIGRGVSDMASGVGSAVKGAAQMGGVVSGVTPTVRAVQAANEKSLFTPMSTRRTGLQAAMGINSWTPEEDAAKDRAERFEQLKDMYRDADKAGNFELKRRVRAEMEKVDPAAYKKIVARSRAARAERARKRWASIADRVGPVERPEDYLARLSAED